MRYSGLLFVAAVMAAGISLESCASAGAPRERPVPTQPIETGAGSLQGVRRQLEGAWELVSIETYPEPGRTVVLKAVGRLTYDGFGNLVIQARLDEAGAGTVEELPYLEFKGRAIIDVARQELVLTNVEGNVPVEEAVPGELLPDRRGYEFEDDLLKMTVIDESGQTTARVTYRKID